MTRASLFPLLVMFRARPRASLLAGLLLCSCASTPVLESPPQRPPPGARSIEGAGGTRLFVDEQRPPMEPRAVLLHVLGSEVGSAPLYPKLSAALLAEGVAIAALHVRGSGWSEGPRGDLEDYSLLLDDQRRSLAWVRARFPGLPVFVIGHSAGATLALELAAHAPERDIAGLVIVNPAFKLKSSDGMGPSVVDIVAFAGNLVCRPSVPTVDMNSNPAAVAYGPDREEAVAMQRDPLVVRHFSMRQLMAQKQVMDRSAHNAALVKAPILLVEGTHDALVDPVGNDEILAAAAANADARRLVVDAGHGSSAVEADPTPLVAWVLAHLPERWPEPLSP